MAENSACGFVPLNGKVVHGLSAEFRIITRRSRQLDSLAIGNCFVRHSYDSGRRGVLLQATAVATSAELTFGLYRNMSEFAGHSNHAVPNAPVEHDSPTNAGTQSQHGYVIKVACRSQPLLAKGCDIRIVIQDDPRAQSFFNLRPHRRISPSRQIRRFANHSGPHVNDPRHTNADAL